MQAPLHKTEAIDSAFNSERPSQLYRIMEQKSTARWLEVTKFEAD